ncbi:hypothetical protein HYU11_01700 [Candidatus Woesearchaeota archaeon]|nr:hypothetical protein [Candidatus Woesearchaeota archaeon]
MKGKRGYVLSWGDWFKGFVIGIVLGAAVVYMFVSGMLNPYFSTIINDLIVSLI